jgi:hypothetical protein
MNNINHDQLKMLKKLYNTGRIADIPMKMIQVMPYGELENFIIQKQQAPAKTFEPMAENYRNMLLEMIEAGHLKISRDDLQFMSQRKAEKFYWMGKNSISDGVALCRKDQYKRLRNMMKEGYITYMTYARVKMLTAREAETLLKEGEKNISDMKFKE